jgi:hypothetical protein
MPNQFQFRSKTGGVFIAESENTAVAIRRRVWGVHPIVWSPHLAYCRPNMNRAGQHAQKELDRTGSLPETSQFTGVAHTMNPLQDV